MPQTIEVPGYGSVEFPDSMNDAQIVDAIKANAPTPSKEKPGVGTTIMRGVGRTVDQIGAGMKQLYYGATGNDEAALRLTENQKGQDLIYADATRAHPIAAAIGEAAPTMALPLGGAVRGVGLLGTSMLAGALPGALEYGSAAERGTRGVLGAAGGLLGAGAGGLVTRALKPGQSLLNATGQEAVQAGERMGMNLTAGMTTGNRAMQQLEAVLARTPGASGYMQGIEQTNNAALNRAAATAMGETGDEITQGTFAAARARTGGEFQRLAGKTTVGLGDDFVNALAKVEGANKQLGAFASPEINTLVDKGLDLAVSGHLAGSAYQTLRSRLSARAADAFGNGNSEVGTALKALRDGLDESARAGMSAADREAWDVARKQWANMRVLEKGKVVEGGNVSAARTASALQQANPVLYKGGQLDTPLADIARIGEVFKPIANSGSPERIAMHNMMFGNPITGVPVTGAAYLARLAYMNPATQRYLTHELFNLSPRAIQSGQVAGGLLGGAGPNAALYGLLTE